MPLTKESTNIRDSLRMKFVVGKVIYTITNLAAIKDLPRVILHKKIQAMKLKIDMIINVEFFNVNYFFLILGTKTT